VKDAEPPTYSWPMKVGGNTASHRTEMTKPVTSHGTHKAVAYLFRSLAVMVLFLDWQYWVMPRVLRATTVGGSWRFVNPGRCIPPRRAISVPPSERLWTWIRLLKLLSREDSSYDIGYTITCELLHIRVSELLHTGRCPMHGAMHQTRFTHSWLTARTLKSKRICGTL
jgi:hypothetical protein